MALSIYILFGMIRVNQILACLFFVMCAVSCKKMQGTKVIIYARVPVNIKLYIKSVPFFDEKEKIIDSATFKNSIDTIVLYVPEQQEERLFKITIPGSHIEATFINDTRQIKVHIHYFDHHYDISGSPATTNLERFENSQIKISAQLSKLVKPIDSLHKLHITGPQIDTLQKQFDVKLHSYLNRNIGYADTVKSPAAFVEVYNSIDFDTDYKGLKKFIVNNAARFPNYKPIQQIKAKAMATVRIYEEEFYVGDKIPSISLPDTNGIAFSTSSLKGQYYLIDFWSTLCDQCMAFKIAQKNIFVKGNSKVKFISVALDDQKDNWKSMISRNKLNWTQLIDEKIWEGPAVNTLVFDSIPFNFLVSPQGKIIKKAIQPDSLAKVIAGLK